MVQQFQALRCFSCQVFQVQQVKKSKKWSCKLCGEKQSQLKVYGQGSGADCRRHVQMLNLLQGQAERAATGTAGESGQNALDGDQDLGDETRQSLAVSQEAAMSRWNKYMEDTSDDAHEEEEEGCVSADHEDYHSHQDCTPRTVRKRKHFPYYGGDFYKEDMKENTSKKNKMDEDGNAAKAGQISSRITEDMGNVKSPAPPLPCTLPLQRAAYTLPPMSAVEGRAEQSSCSTASCLQGEPRMDPIFNHFRHTKKIGTGSSATGGRGVLPNAEPPTGGRPHQSGLGGAEPQSDIGLRPGASVSLQKPTGRGPLFQTDEDFDDDY